MGHLNGNLVSADHPISWFPVCLCEPIRLSSLAQSDLIHNSVYGSFTGDMYSLRLLQQQSLIHSDPSISIVTVILADDFLHGIRQILVFLRTVLVHEIFIKDLPTDTKYPVIK